MSRVLLARRGATAGQGGGDALTVLSDLWTDPMSSSVASGFTAAASGTALSYTSATTTLWDSGAFNEQGQLWTAHNSGNHADGCKNLTTSLQISSSPCSSVITVRTIVQGGGKFGLVFKTGAQADYNVHIRKVGSGQPLKRVAAYPVIDTGFGTRRVNITCPSVDDWEVWATASQYTISLSLPSTTFRFVGVEHDGAATLTAPPDRKVFIADGDSHWHSAGAGVQGSAQSFKSFGIIDRVEELTGMVGARIANGGSGWFTAPGVLTAVDINYSTTGGASCFGSTLRRTIAQSLITQDTTNIVAYIVNGSYNDGSKSGGSSAMQTRVSAFANWLHGIDPHLPLVCIGPEPHNDWPAADATGVHNDNRLGIKQAMATATNRTTNSDHDGFIDPAVPTPWYTGTGDEDTAGTGTQPTVIGADGLHPNYAGVLTLGGDVVTGLGVHQIPTTRATGVA